MGARSPGLVVLQSFPEPSRFSNPYISLLADSLRTQPGVAVLTFTYRRALLSRFDVFHAHWPENLATGRGWFKTAVRQVLFLVILLRLRLTRTPLVRTLHNVDLPTGLGLRQRALIQLTHRWTSLFITLNDITPVPDGRPSEVILHGHYRDWFAAQPRMPRTPRRLVFVGRIRRYKGVEGLLHAFAELPDVDGTTQLRIVGLVSTTELADSLSAEASSDPRITLHFDYVSDTSLVAEISAASVIVLPYPRMHNSGTVLAALSLGRPVLVPDNDINRALADEVGPGWVECYRGELTGQHLLNALERAESADLLAEPNLSRRDWSESARRHVATYHRAIGSR